MATSTKNAASKCQHQHQHQQALESLAPLRPLLAGFNHRNRNQHRGARWWGAFGMLRRHVSKLIDELDAAAAAAAAVKMAKSSSSSATKTSNKKKKRKRGGEEEDAGKGVGAAADARATWLRAALVPRCYM